MLPTTCVSVQHKCRNRHPAEARGGSRPNVEQRTVSKQERAAAWRAFNAATQHQQPPSSEQHDSAPACRDQQSSATQVCNYHSKASVQDGAAGAARIPNAPAVGPGTPVQPPASPAVSLGMLAATSTRLHDSALTAESRQAAQHSINDAVDIASAPARKKVSYARANAAGAQQRHSMSNACAADAQTAGQKRLKIRNRFRAGVFRRC